MIVLEASPSANIDVGTVETKTKHFRHNYGFGSLKMVDFSFVSTKVKG